MLTFERRGINLFFSSMKFLCVLSHLVMSDYDPIDLYALKVSLLGKWC